MINGTITGKHVIFHPITLISLFGFIGCNPVGPNFAWATADGPGAAPCDKAYLRSQVEALKDQVDVAVATMQYWEIYQYEPTWKLLGQQPDGTLLP